MGKSIRSKIKVRLRTAKRQRVDAMIITPRVKAQHEALQRVIEGRSVTFTKPKNAFKYPNDPTSVFPQHEIMKPIDFRSSHLPMASYAFRGNRRKYEGEQAEYMQQLAKNSHPEMEVLAGGGAILSSGKHVSVREAEILATAARNPDAVAAAVSEPTADAAAASAGDAPMEVSAGDAAAGPAAMVQPAGAVAADEEQAVPDPVDEADHSRIPVLKDTRRAKRAAEHRPRSNAVKKKTKIKVQSTSAPASSSAPPAQERQEPQAQQPQQQQPQQQPALAPVSATPAPQGDTDRPNGKTKKKKNKKGKGASADVDMA